MQTVHSLNVCRAIPEFKTAELSLIWPLIKLQVASRISELDEREKVTNQWKTNGTIVALVQLTSLLNKLQKVSF